MIHDATMSLSPIYAACVFMTLAWAVASTNDTKEPLRLSFLSSTSDDAKFFAGAFFLALDNINNNTTILKDYKLQYLFNDTKSDTLESIRAMTSQYENKAIGFIGPDVSCACESTNAAAWNLPMIVYVSRIILKVFLSLRFW